MKQSLRRSKSHCIFDTFPCGYFQIRAPDNLYCGYYTGVEGNNVNSEHRASKTQSRVKSPKRLKTENNGDNSVVVIARSYNYNFPDQTSCRTQLLSSYVEVEVVMYFFQSSTSTSSCMYLSKMKSPILYPILLEVLYSLRSSMGRLYSWSDLNFNQLEYIM